MTRIGSGTTAQRAGIAVALGAVVVPLALSAPAAAGADGPGTEVSGPHAAVRTEGTLPGDAAYTLHKPASWDGSLVVLAGRPALDATVVDWLVEQNHGVVGYELSDEWDLEQDRDNARAALQAFSATAGEPETVVVSGRSQGGLITRIVADAQPDWLDGALPMCGGGAGNISTWNYKLDTAFALRELVDPDSPMRITGIEDTAAELAAMNSLVDEAASTPEGRARVVLAAALSKIPAVDPDTGEPLPRERLDARIERYLAHMPFAIGSHVRAGYEQTVGGAFSWNTGVDYGRALRNSGRWPEIVAAYRAAGLSLAGDLETLDGAPRIAADPEAVAFVERTATFAGELDAPVLSLHTTGDGAGSVQDDEGYADTVREAGAAPLLRQTFVSADGHCTFAPAEEAAAFEALFDRIWSGHWAGTSPPAMDTRAAELASGSGVGLGGSRFTQPQHRGIPARPWDARDWGDYTG